MVESSWATVCRDDVGDDISPEVGSVSPSMIGNGGDGPGGVAGVGVASFSSKIMPPNRDSSSESKFSKTIV